MDTTKKESRKLYLKTLREQWQKAKELSSEDERIETMTEAAKKLGVNPSPYSISFVLMQLDAQGLSGSPYIDTKTFKGWLDSGYCVKKGEKSTIKSITWIEAKNKQDEKESFLFPKTTNLFHSSQVEKTV